MLVRRVVVAVAPDQAELVADRLWALGAQAVQEVVSDAGDVELVTSFGEDDEANALANLRSAGLRVVVDALDDASYLDTWRSHANVVTVSERLVVVPAWLASHGVDTDAVVITIDPGRAFGSGQHATTLLVLRALVELVTPGTTVADIGCGSGVLSVAAARLGAARVDGVDVEIDAVSATTANAVANGVGDLVQVELGSAHRLDGPYDLVVANVLAATLVAIADDLKRLVAPTGRLVLSGVLSDRWDHVASALAPLVVESVDELDGWAAVTMRWPPTVASQ